MTIITIVVKDDSGECAALEVEHDSPVEIVRTMVRKKMNLPADVKLIFSGRLLRDQTILHQVGVQHQSTLHILLPATNTEKRCESLNDMPENLLLLQNHLLQNPDIMQQMMNSPAMQSLLNDTKFLRSILAMNPRVRHIMGPGSELSRMMDDPEFTAQALDAFRNPSMMRDLLRSTEKAMQQLGYQPGADGASLLEKMYEALKWPDGKVKERDLEKENVPKDFDSNAMAAMMQDPNLQQLLAQAFNTKDEDNPLGNPAVLAMLFRPGSMQGMAFAEESVGALALGKVAKEQTVMPPHFCSTFSSFLQAQRENPELQYRTQLASMRNMGFHDTEQAIAALIASDGSVQGAIDKILADSKNS